MGDDYTRRNTGCDTGRNPGLITGVGRSRDIRKWFSRAKRVYTKGDFILLLAVLQVCVKFPQEDTSSLLKACDDFLKILFENRTATFNKGAFANLQNRFDSTAIQEKGELFEYLKSQYMSAKNLHVLSDQIMAFIAMAGLQYNVPQHE